jgi:hypothetical protein
MKASSTSLLAPRTRPRRVWCICVGMFALAGVMAGCLRNETDSHLYSSYVLPADASVPKLDDDKNAAKKLDANDGVGATIPLRSAFYAGRDVQYWDFGPVAALSVKPMWVFRRKAELDSGAPEEFGHPDLIDSIPGDTAYTPLRQIYVVFVTPSYRGEHITSLRALEDAVELGIVEAPQPAAFFVNCSVVVATVQMQVDGDTAMGPQPAFYRGLQVMQFCPGGLVATVGAFSLNKDDGTFSVGNAFVVRRADEVQPLDEVVQKRDLNGDGDMIDTNVIFDATVNDPTYSSIWHAFDVVVPRSYEFGDAKAEADLFDKSGGTRTAKENVVQYMDTGVLYNRPIKQVAQ